MPESKTLSGIIYRISSTLTDSVYIGSTTQSTRAILNKQRVNYRAFLKGKYHHKSVFDIIKLDNVDINIIESITFSDKKELRARTAVILEQYPTAVNKNVPGREKAQYREDNKERIKTYASERGKTKQQCETCGAVYTLGGKRQHQWSTRHDNALFKLAPTSQEARDEIEMLNKAWTKFIERRALPRS